MPIQKLIIHSLEKEQHTRNVTPLISEDTIEVEDDAILEFCNNLIDAYKNDSKISNSKFKENSLFKKDYDSFYWGNQNFVESTSNMMAKMELVLGNVTAAKGGKFAFIQESRDSNNFFYVFLIRDVTGGQIKYSKSKKKYILNSIEYADTNNLAMAVRVNNGIYEDQKSELRKNYLSFTYSGIKQNEVSGYFSDWVGADDIHKNSEYATDLRKAISIIGDFDEDEFAGSVTEKLQSVIGFAESNKDDIINIYSLSEYLYGRENRNLVRNTLEKNNLIFTERFPLISSSKNSFKSISAKVNNITLRFPRHYYDDEIVDVSDGIVTIRDRGLADKVMRDLNSQQE
tara:strand:- start:189849 stop:190877 length:1029 start_codon:yes stop_codon:yes gene_type:complete